MMAGGALLYRSIDSLYFIIGVLLTSSLNIGKIVLLNRTVQRTLDMDNPDKGKTYIRLQYLMRYFLTGAVLLAAGIITMYVEPPFINLWGALAGVFTLQISVIITRHMKIEED